MYAKTRRVGAYRYMICVRFLNETETCITVYMSCCVDYTTPNARKRGKNPKHVKVFFVHYFVTR